MAKEVVPVEIKEGKREYLFDMDEEFQRVNYERLPTLNPAFTKGYNSLAGAVFRCGEQTFLFLLCYIV